MLLDNWDDFVERAKALYLADPLRTRYVLRYTHQKQRLVVKVTDDKTCLRYHTDQQSQVKKLDELNVFFLSLMSGMTVEEMEANAVADEAPAPVQQGKKGKSGKPSKRRN